ncbi:hypothetical protein B0G84_5021 [Paraburkholderia sp. BL8N3]|nr:hypothetical protein B0G84_5021 [Paraburkholderia sp. BL8N3]
MLYLLIGLAPFIFLDWFLFGWSGRNAPRIQR